MKRLVVLLCLLCPPLLVGYVDPSTGLPHATQVLRGADIPEKKWLPGHRGVDLALEVGAEVVASDDGIVAFAGRVAGTPVVSIDHADGIRTTYQPVHAVVAQGDEVAVGQVVGKLAHPVDGHPGLHWGARTGPDEYLNPLTLLDRPVIRLKPLDGPADTRL
ncbi:M23 family metallopeptidase [Corynebacterium breve]|uniref:M23 family metallopeptidase n=1 Tax=Corynebacterium breve TaxID=3049799 RepID=A0ABY8VB42_9CORY|nr:M23 family metallopeptidase [Corynebacterium breve]WIM66879.1 M23 family metallopeptidase [Corynebacterium breve]